MSKSQLKQHINRIKKDNNKNKPSKAKLSKKDIAIRGLV